MASSPPDAFLLLVLPNATVRTPAGTHTGALHLKCVTIAPPNASTDREVFLVLSINSFESPLDPSRVVHVVRASSGQRVYTFDGTDDDPSDLVLTVIPPPPATATAKERAGFEEDMDTFDSVMAQYADLRRQGSAPTYPPPTSTAPVVTGIPEGKRDFRGQLIMVNEANGEFLGEVDKKFSIHEDPVLHEHGHENDAVIIEVPEGRELDAFEMFARAVPPEDHHWITQSATVIR
jgi:spartin